MKQAAVGLRQCIALCALASGLQAQAQDGTPDPGRYSAVERARLGVTSPPGAEPVRRLRSGVSEDAPRAAGEASADAVVLAAAGLDSAALQRLVDRGASPNSTDPGGRTALMACVEAMLYDNCRVLLRAGADPERKVAGRTAVGTAVRRGSHRLVDLLLASGADPGRREDNGDTPLHVAAALGREREARALLARGADGAARNRQGWTPLIVATRGGHLGVMEALLAAGADPDGAGRDAFRPLYWAVYRGNRKAAELLVRAGAEVGSLSLDGLPP